MTALRSAEDSNLGREEQRRKDERGEGKGN
jgi:hypothetical protein